MQILLRIRRKGKCIMGKKLIGQIAVSAIVTTLAAITGVAMMVLAGDKVKDK